MLERKKQKNKWTKSGCIGIWGEKSSTWMIETFFSPWLFACFPGRNRRNSSDGWDFFYFLNAYQMQEINWEEIKMRRKRSLTLIRKGKKKKQQQQQPRSLWLERTIYVMGKMQRRNNSDLQSVIHLKLTFFCLWLFGMIDLIKDISICPSISCSDSLSYILRERKRREGKKYFTLQNHDSYEVYHLLKKITANNNFSMKKYIYILALERKNSKTSF